MVASKPDSRQILDGELAAALGDIADHTPEHAVRCRDPAGRARNDNQRTAPAHGSMTRAMILKCLQQLLDMDEQSVASCQAVVSAGIKYSADVCR